MRLELVDCIMVLWVVWLDRFHMGEFFVVVLIDDNIAQPTMCFVDIIHSHSQHFVRQYLIHTHILSSDIHIFMQTKKSINIWFLRNIQTTTSKQISKRKTCIHICTISNIGRCYRIGLVMPLGGYETTIAGWYLPKYD